MLDEDLPKYYDALNAPEPTPFVKFLGELVMKKKC
jgi:hypothetical protein